MQDNISYFAIPGIRKTEIPVIIRKIDSKEVIKATSRYFSIKEENLTTRSRKRENVYPRMLAVYLLKTNTHLPLSCICSAFGNAVEHHTSVMHYVREVSNLIYCEDANAIRDLIAITSMLNNPNSIINN